MKAKEKTTEKINNKVAIILIVLSTILVYSNSLKNSFVWDDPSVITDNNFIKSWKNLPSLFTKDCLSVPYVEGGSGEITYRPVVTFSYFLDYSIWKLNPFGYHFTNLLLHIINAILLYFLINLIANNKKIGLLTSLLFAFHPINTEAVNVISFREDLLTFLFFTFSLILHIKQRNYTGKNKVFLYIFSLISFAFALFSKETGLVFILLFMLYDYFFIFDHNIWKQFDQYKLRYLGYIIILLFYIWIRFFLITNLSEFQVEYPGGSFYTNILTMSKVFSTYIWCLFFPLNLNATLLNISSWIPHSLLEPSVLFSIILLFGILIFAIWINKSSRGISFALFWYLLILLPTSNILPLMSFMAYRYLYVPSAGFCFLVSLIILELNTPEIKFYLPHFLNNFKKIVIVVLLISYSIITYNRNHIWKDDFVFWNKVILDSRGNDVAEAYNGRGFAYTQGKGDFDRAIADFNKAIEIKPNYDYPYYNRGHVYQDKGDLDRAIADYDKAIENNPKFSLAYSNRGLAYQDRGDLDRAIADYDKAIEINPTFALAYNNRGFVYHSKGELDRAITDYNKAIQIDSSLALAYYNRGSVYFLQKEYDRSLSDIRKAQSLGRAVDPRLLEELKKVLGGGK